LGLFGFMAALYFTHVLWWAMAGAWLAAAGFLGRLPWREQAKRLVSLVPFALLAAWWFPQLKERGFTSAVFWDRPGLHRLVPAEFVGSVLGGIRGSTEPIVVSCLLVWLAAGVWGSRRRWREVGHADLGIAALVFLLAAIALPYKVENTIRFGQRWMPIAALFAVLYIPPPRIAVRLRLLVAVALLAGLIAATALTWTTFERVELDGLAEALEALPDGQRVLGLNYAWESPRIAGHPYIQTFAYAQVRHGGSLNFSFADFAPCLVVYRVPRPRPWTNALEWLPREVRQGDFGLFDYVLIHGNESEHAVTSERAPIEAVSRAAPWRLYRVERARNASQR
jgi:prepilin-type processing-associated H-X9-DG protein